MEVLCRQFLSKELKAMVSRLFIIGSFVLDFKWLILRPSIFMGPFQLSRYIYYFSPIQAMLEERRLLRTEPEDTFRFSSTVLSDIQ